ncbi:MAG TPA: PhoH family protein [Thermoanaerobaculia bacterium]|nr:PhoH family protein [Thermoanaerobaculia bacterium]
MTRLSLGEQGLDAFFGTNDENLRRLEKAFGVHVAARGDELKIDGDPAGVATTERLFSELSELAAGGYRFKSSEIATAIRILTEDREASVVRFFQPEGPLASVRRMVAPRSLRQQQYLQAMIDHDIVISVGPAGTGKTYLAVAMAAAALADKRVRRIVLARPAVEAGEKLGFLPGDLAEKVNPYLRPLYDSLYDLIGYDKVTRMLERSVIEVAPLAFMRGRTLNDSFIILDEAQNTTTEQMKMCLTRVGLNSKAVINGDVTQVDLPRGMVSGLAEARQVLAGVEGIKFIDFDERDVVRHHLVQRIITAYNRWDQVKQGETS